MKTMILTMILVLGVLAPWVSGDHAAGQGWTAIQAQDRSFVAHSKWRLH